MSVVTKIASDKIFFWSFLLSLLFVLFSAAYTLFSYSKLPPVVPLYNQLPWGESRLGEKIQIFIPISVAFSIFLINLFLSSAFYKKMPLISRIFCVTSVLTNFFALVIVIRAIRLIA
ncbi:MAG: hypothetical protein M1450_02965 [Patescibacteria group bacterium]|nr:hypothetical protein [Patescibacteria group bacterium]